MADFADIYDVVSSGDIGTGMNSDAWNTWSSAFKDSGLDLSKLNLGSLLSAGAGGVAGLLGSGGGGQRSTGYQGKVPVYQAVRQQVPMANQDPARRPGSGGRQYFTNTQYLPRADESGIAAALGKAQQQSDAIAQANLAPTQGQRTALLNAAQSLYPMYTPMTAAPAAAPATPAENTPAAPAESAPEYNPNDASNAGGAAQGGLIGLARGGSTSQPRFLAGGTDGMADKIPATIENKQPAKLGHGEFVIPADVVGFLGSGNSEAGAKVLYAMMDRVRKNAHGSKKQIKPANLKKTLPA
jgi:hypothetical protein